MRKIIVAIIAISFCTRLSAEYIDYRGHNIDSLERVVASWTPQMIDAASDDELKALVLNWTELAQGNLNINRTKSLYYARRIIPVAEERNWRKAQWDAYKIIGQHFWAAEQLDSATYYYKKAMYAVDKMAEGETNSQNPEGYTKEEVDDLRSSLFGTIGNLYSVQDMIDSAMVYYGLAGEIFKDYGWFTSCSVLYYNMGETYLGVKDLSNAKDCYSQALDYAYQANDSLWIASSLKGLGGLYLDQGKTTRALKCLKEADRYFSIHEDEELRFRLETVDFMGQVLSRQKQNLLMILLGAILVLALSVSVAVITRKLRRTETEKEEVEEILEETIAETPVTPDVKLNDREMAILKMLSEGKETAEMADALCLSTETIKWYRKRLLFKFDVTSAAALMAEVYKRGIL